MSGITVPTLDEITGHTVMAKLRSLCKKFIGLAQEVDDKIDAPLEEAHLAVETANATLATAQESLENANSAVTTANSASATANEASESAQESAETVAGYNTRLTTVENGKINITDINNYAVGLTGNQTDILGNKSFKGTVDFKSISSFSSNDFVSSLVKTIYSNSDANNTILEERQVTKESANTIRFDTRNRMSKDGTNANRIDTYLRTVVNETNESVTLQLFILVYENNVQVRGKSMTIATLSATS